MDRGSDLAGLKLIVMRPPVFMRLRLALSIQTRGERKRAAIAATLIAGVFVLLQWMDSQKQAPPRIGLRMFWAAYSCDPVRA
jgi:hypothetical protein